MHIRTRIPRGQASHVCVCRRGINEEPRHARERRRCKGRTRGLPTSSSSSFFFHLELFRDSRTLGGWLKMLPTEKGDCGARRLLPFLLVYFLFDCKVHERIGWAAQRYLIRRRDVRVMDSWIIIIYICDLWRFTLNAVYYWNGEMRRSMGWWFCWELLSLICRKMICNFFYKY